MSDKSYEYEADDGQTVRLEFDMLRNLKVTIGEWEPDTVVLDLLAHDLVTRIEQLEAENERLRGLLSVAVCPDKDCDNHGTIAVQELVGYNEHGEAETDVDLQQCQWCDMRMELTKEGTDETT